MARKAKATATATTRLNRFRPGRSQVGPAPPGAVVQRARHAIGAPATPNCPPHTEGCEKTSPRTEKPDRVRQGQDYISTGRLLFARPAIPRVLGMPLPKTTVRPLSGRPVAAARLAGGKRTEMRKAVAGGCGCRAVAGQPVLLGLLLGLAHNCTVRSFSRTTMTEVIITLPLLEPTASQRKKGRPFKEFIVRSALPTSIQTTKTDLCSIPRAKASANAMLDVVGTAIRKASNPTVLLKTAMETLLGRHHASAARQAVPATRISEWLTEDGFAWTLLPLNPDKPKEVAWSKHTPASAAFPAHSLHTAVARKNRLVSTPLQSSTNGRLTQSSSE